MRRSYPKHVTAFILLAVSVVVTPAWAAPSDSAAGSAVYKSKCASCHGADGAGTATGHSLNVVDLRSATVQGQSDTQLEQIVKNGKNNMPAFSGTLTDQQITEVLAHVRTFKKKGGASGQ